MAEKFRNIGLGIIGLGDAMIMLGLRYGSIESVTFCSYLMRFMFSTAVEASIELAKEKGAFPGYSDNVWKADIIKKNINPSIIAEGMKYGLRNCSLLSIAPGGSIANLLGVSNGMEPEFALSYYRTTKSLGGEKDTVYKVDAPIVEYYRKTTNNTGKLPDYFVTAADLDWNERINVQAALQDACDTGISSTVNLPEDISLSDMEQLYLYAWKKGLKGITVFRSGCKRTAILTTKKEDPLRESAKQLVDTMWEQKHLTTDPKNRIGKIRTLTTGCVDKDTEYFNGTEWKKISEYTEGEQVMQYNLDGTATLVTPLAYIKRPSSGFYHITSKYGLDMMITKDHRNVTFKPYKDTIEILTTDELLDKHASLKYGFQGRFKSSFIYNGSGINLTDNQIRISIAIFADGCFYSPTSNKCLISVSKERKYQRIISLLEAENIEYSDYKDSDGFYNIKFYPPIPFQKTFPKEWYQCSQHQLQVIYDEVFRWDGYEKEHNEYVSIIKSNADFIQFVCTAVGYRASIFEDTREKKHSYKVCWTKRIYCSIVEKNKKDIPFVESEDKIDYCFSVPSTMLVLRRNNKIFVTGNCGTLHLTCFFDKYTGQLVETFFAKGSTGGCNNYMNGLSRMISLSAKKGATVDEIVDQLNSTGACPSFVRRTALQHDTSKGSCCAMAAGYAIKEMYDEMQQELGDCLGTTPKPKEESIEEPKSGYPTCPECGASVQMVEGCVSCPNCGYSKCG